MFAFAVCADEVTCSRLIIVLDFATSSTSELPLAVSASVSKALAIVAAQRTRNVGVHFQVKVAGSNDMFWRSGTRERQDVCVDQDGLTIAVDSNPPDLSVPPASPRCCCHRCHVNEQHPY